ncbi:DUF3887 domain-containing protein [Peptoniphilus asaccharolyticus]
MKKFLVSVIMLVIFITACGRTNSVENSDKYITIGQDIINKLNENDFEEIRKVSVDEFKEGLNETICDAVVKDLASKGKFLSFEKNQVFSQKDKKTNKEYFVLVQEAKYENGKLTFTLTFDENDKLGGLYYK